MCTVMVVDNSQTRRNWLQECIQNSNIKLCKIILCKSCEEALKYISSNNIDIMLTRVEKKNNTSVEFVKAIHKKLMFSILLGYGACKDFNLLCNIVNGGVSQYLPDVFDEAKLKSFLNEAYERYCSSKIRMKSIEDQAKGKAEKAYSNMLLHQWVDSYERNAIKNNEKNVDAYIDFILDIMDKQQLYYSKSMILELMIIITEHVNKGMIKSDYVLFNSKDYSTIMNFKNISELKKMIQNYIKNLARNIYLMSSTTDYKALFVISATTFIKKNYRNNISRDDVSSAVNLNPSYFSKFFKEQTGEPFVSYLRRIRLEEAKTILSNTDDTVKVICEKVGYSDCKYFARLFYKHTGYTPYEYRKTIAKLMA